MKRFVFAALALAIIFSLGFGCSKKETALTQFDVPVLDRDNFNRLATAHEVPLFWQADANNNKKIEAGELIPVGAGLDLKPYVVNGKLTDQFQNLYRSLVEARRIELVQEELDQGRPTVVYNDFRYASPSDRAVLRHLVKAGQIIDELYQIQKGGFKYLPNIPDDDKASMALFDRNMGPWCEAPKTQNDPICNAIAAFPQKISDAYPADLQKNKDMCEKITKMENAKELLSPFTVVREVGGKLKALPLTDVYGDQMGEVAYELKEAAKKLEKDEEAFKTYLIAAAKGFETNDWSEADEAWVAMNARNSKWYLRIAPDETYFDPCSEKAGFHMALAKIDQSSLEWQDKLNPLRDQMEQNLADLIGESYKARKVSFEFPDFIEIVLNSGDSRHNLGATIGQSLPNWGKVAEEGRRRTVVMTNLYTDPDSVKVASLQADSLLAPETMKYYSDDETTRLVGIILHEVTHNFGPHTDYKVSGMTPAEIFGGKKSTILEELKAQTGALWYVDFLRKKGILTDEDVKKIYTHSIFWCFGHISRGMFTGSGNPKPYSQLSAIQIGTFVKDGALSFINTVDPKTGEKMDKFEIDFEKLPASIEMLMKMVGEILATGNTIAAENLITNFVTGSDSRYVQMREIKDRVLKYSKASFYYSVQY